MRRLPVAVVALAAAIVSVAPPALAWQAAVRVGVPNGNADAWARALAVDDDGNVPVVARLRRDEAQRALRTRRAHLAGAVNPVRRFGLDSRGAAS